MLNASMPEFNYRVGQSTLGSMYTDSNRPKGVIGGVSDRDVCPRLGLSIGVNQNNMAFPEQFANSNNSVNSQYIKYLNTPTTSTANQYVITTTNGEDLSNPCQSTIIPNVGPNPTNIKVL